MCSLPSGVYEKVTGPCLHGLSWPDRRHRDLLTRHDRLVHEPGANQARRGTNREQMVKDSPHQAKTPLLAGSGSPDSIVLSSDAGNVAIVSENDVIQDHQIQQDVYDGVYDGLHDRLHDSIHDGISNHDFPCVDFFSSFLDEINLRSNPFSPAYRPVPYFCPESHIFSTEYDVPERSGADHGRAASGDRLCTDLSRYGSRLPSLQPEDQPRESVINLPCRAESFQRVSASCRERFVTLMASFADVIDRGFVLPSRHALHRFVSGYISVFHEHFPILHLPTLTFEAMSLELFLSVVALGAQYCHEREKAYVLFKAGKAVALETVRRRDLCRPGMGTSILGQSHSPHLFMQACPHPNDAPIWSKAPRLKDMVETVQAFILLIAVSMWSEVTPAASDALSMRGVLEELVHGLPETPATDATCSSSWYTWIQAESFKRTKLIAYCFLNLCTLVFDVPPMHLFTDIDISLPSSQRAWTATGEKAWAQTQHNAPPTPGLLHAYWYLFSENPDAHAEPQGVSSLGCYVLIHAIIQHVWLLQKAARSLRQGNTISAVADTSSIERALKRWRHLWEHDQEASIDPLSPHGPLSFNSTALLRIAYIRLNIDSGSARSLASWDPQRIAMSLYQSPPIQRGDKMTRAALHCAHALSVPIKLGIRFVAHTQVFFWSNQHALCSLECALLLSK